MMSLQESSKWVDGTGIRLSAARPAGMLAHPEHLLGG